MDEKGRPRMDEGWVDVDDSQQNDAVALAGFGSVHLNDDDDDEEDLQVDEVEDLPREQAQEKPLEQPDEVITRPDDEPEDLQDEEISSDEDVVFTTTQQPLGSVVLEERLERGESLSSEDGVADGRSESQSESEDELEDGSEKEPNVNMDEVARRLIVTTAFKLEVECPEDIDLQNSIEEGIFRNLTENRNWSKDKNGTISTTMPVLRGGHVDILHVLTLVPSRLKSDFNDLLQITVSVMKKDSDLSRWTSSMRGGGDFHCGYVPVVVKDPKWEEKEVSARLDFLRSIVREQVQDWLVAENPCSMSAENGVSEALLTSMEDCAFGMAEESIRVVRNSDVLASHGAIFRSKSFFVGFGFAGAIALAGMAPYRTVQALCVLSSLGLLGALCCSSPQKRRFRRHIALILNVCLLFLWLFALLSSSTDEEVAPTEATVSIGARKGICGSNETLEVDYNAEPPTLARLEMLPESFAPIKDLITNLHAREEKLRLKTIDQRDEVNHLRTFLTEALHKCGWWCEDTKLNMGREHGWWFQDDLEDPHILFLQRVL